MSQAASSRTAVLFDLDGTLLDSLQDLACSMNAVLARLGLAEHPVDAYRFFVGNGMDVLVRRALPEERRDRETIGQAAAMMRDEYGRRWHRQTRPYPGIAELLDELTRQGVTMCILSNKPDDFTRLAVARLLPDWPFAVVRGARPGVPRKPDPTAARQLAAELEMASRDFLFLGDSSIDMHTAIGAGMFPVGALWGFRSAEELEKSGAQALIDRPDQLLALL